MPAPVIDIDPDPAPPANVRPMHLGHHRGMTLPQVVVPFAAGVGITLLIMWICMNSGKKKD